MSRPVVSFAAARRLTTCLVVWGMLGSGAAGAQVAEPPRFDTKSATTYRRITWKDFRGKASRSEGQRAHIATSIESEPFDVKTTLINRGSPGGGQTEGIWVAVPHAWRSMR